MSKKYAPVYEQFDRVHVAVESCLFPFVPCEMQGGYVFRLSGAAMIVSHRISCLVR